MEDTFQWWGYNPENHYSLGVSELNWALESVMIYMLLIRSSKTGQVRYVRWFDTKIMPTDTEDRRKLILALGHEIDLRINYQTQEYSPADKSSDEPDNISERNTDGFFRWKEDKPFSVVYITTPENVFVALIEAHELPFLYLEALYDSLAALMATFKILEPPSDILLTFQFQKVYAVMDQVFVAGRIRSCEASAIADRVSALDECK